MKTLYNICESLLDSDLEIIEKSLPWALVKKFHSFKRSKSPKSATDMFNSDIQVGDMVLGVYQNRPSIGIVLKIQLGMCSVCFTGDKKDMKLTSNGDYQTNVPIYDLLKINEKVSQQLIKK